MEREKERGRERERVEATVHIPRVVHVYGGQSTPSMIRFLSSDMVHLK